jgi:hypothetical protein
MRRLALGLAFAGCAKEDSGAPPSRPEPSEPTTPPEHTADSEPQPTVDCDARIDAPVSVRTLPDARAYHGLAFDDDGTLVGWDGSRTLTKSPYDGPAVPFVPGMLWVEQIDRLPDGDFAVAEISADRVARVSSDGATDTVASGVGVLYGVTVGPDGHVYVANGDVYRAHVDTSALELVVDLGAYTPANAVDFSLDSTTMYIGTLSRSLFAVPLDAALNATSAPVEVARIGNWHDAVAVDECGDIWVPEHFTTSLYRVDGETFEVVEVYTPETILGFGHGAVWGNGSGGWRTDALYQPLPYDGNTVQEVVIDARSGDHVRTWNGARAP